MVTHKERKEEQNKERLRKQEQRIQLVILGVLLGLLLIGAVSWWVVKSSFEASTYNRLTGANVSTWDAMWVELRVQEPLNNARSD